MKVAFRLRRLAQPAPAAALLLLSHRPEDVLRLCATLGCDPLPDIYPVADGMLLRLSRAAGFIPAGDRTAGINPAARQTGRTLLDVSLAGVIRLRSQAQNLLLPADAELVPALLEDEAAALTRQRGLVFLPGGRVLEFHPHAPLPPAALLALPNLRRQTWLPLPERPPLADRLIEITLEREEPPPEVLLESGGADIGSEETRPADSGTPAKALGRVAFGVGKGLAWLGNALHLRGLTRAGAKLMSGAMNLAPRLSEKLLGRQEASLRDLLREFREGNIDRALRRALPLGGNTARGAAPAQSSRLPWNKILYALQDLLSGDSGRPSIWFSRFDAWHELEREYRKQAELALRAGDYRRAAFIYGKLLRDYRSAAAALAQGGLHHDAAILYLARVHDSEAAAREFEAAGEIDRALKLYRKRGDHALAGDLLRRAGEEDLAVAEYRLAAAKLVEAGPQYYEAGELLLTRAQRPDLAREYYQTGWEQRPGGSPVPCAIRLAQLFSQEQANDKLVTLLTEAERFLTGQGSDTEAGEFFNEIARLAERPALVSLRDDLRDRALMGLAARMRLRAGEPRQGDLASTLLASSAGWSPALVSDGAYAVKTTPGPMPTARNPGPSVKLPAPAKAMGAQAALTWTVLPARKPMVRAVCQAPETGDLFVGFESGEVFCFSPLRGEVIAVADERRIILSLATDPGSANLVVVSLKGPEEVHLSSYAFRRLITSLDLNIPSDWVVPWLAPMLLVQEHCVVVALNTNSGIRILDSISLLPSRYQTIERGDLVFEAAVLLPPREMPSSPSLLALAHGELLYYDDLESGHHSTWTVGWRSGPVAPEGGRLAHPSVSGLQKHPESLELAGVSEQGTVCWSNVEIRDGKLARVTTKEFCSKVKEPFQAACLVNAGLIAAVTRTTIQWLHHSAKGFVVAATKKHSLRPVVACYPHYRGNELILICEDGTIARVWNLRY